MHAQVLIIEDDSKLAVLIRDYLQDNGYKALTASDGKEGLEVYEQQPIDAVILDLGLPDIDGLEVCKKLQLLGAPSILMLTARSETMDRIIGLEMGADDYLPKPFEPRELLARLRAILRRGREDTSASTLRFGSLEIDRGAMEARIDGRQCDLTNYQFQLLDILATSPGRVLSRDHLMQQLQGTNLEAFDRSIDVHISRIRAEIEDNPRHPRRVITVRGTGYVFARSQE